MPKAETVSIAFTGDASGLVGAVNQSINAMAQIEARSKSFAASIANMTVRQLAPIATAVAGAFAAKQALQDFMGSDLPGGKALKSTVEESQKSLKKLSAAVGEFLAPAAEFTARWITKIADTLSPLVRQFTALSQSSTEFLKKLGMNFLAAFAPLIPTATAAVNWFKSLFSGPARDWAKDLEAFRAMWNRIWGQILEYTAPIMVAAAGAIEAALAGIKFAAIAAFEATKAILGDIVSLLVDLFPAGAAKSTLSLAELAAAIQLGLVTAFVTVEFAIKNWQATFELAKAAILVGFEAIKDVVGTFGQELWDNMKVVGENLQSVFEVLGENIGTVFKEVFNAAFENAKNMALRIAVIAKNPISFYRDWNDPKSGAFFRGMFNASFPINKSPDFSGTKSLPEMKGLPGFSVPQASDATKAAKAALDALAATFGADLGDFMKDRFPEINASAEELKRRILDGLPNINATPAANTVITSSGKSTAALEFGSREAYSAIIAATGGKDVQKDQLDVLRDIRDNTKSKPKKATL